MGNCCSLRNICKVNFYSGINVSLPGGLILYLIIKLEGKRKHTYFADARQETVGLAKVICKIVISSLFSNKILLK